MARVPFTVLPGAAAPSGATALALTDIQPAFAPVGPEATFLTRFAGTYTALQKARIRQAWADLTDAGILAKLDALFIRMGTEADSLVNWAEGPDATNGGAVWTAGAGFTFTGQTDDWVDLGYTPVNLTSTSAAIFAYSQSTPFVNSILGQSATTQSLRITPAFSANTQSRATLFTTLNVDAAYTGTRVGLWAGTRTGTTNALLRNGVQLGSATHTTTQTPASLFLSRAGTTRAGTVANPAVVSAAGYGAYLTPAELVTLTEVIEAMHAAI